MWKSLSDLYITYHSLLMNEDNWIYSFQNRIYMKDSKSIWCFKVRQVKKCNLDCCSIFAHVHFLNLIPSCISSKLGSWNKINLIFSLNLKQLGGKTNSCFENNTVNSYIRNLISNRNWQMQAMNVSWET